jgi:glycosyltransferase involved in cell wall biosynthesis
MTNAISRVAMFNTHGYFEKTPILGNTDTGGQITMVLELAKGLMRQGVDVDIFTRRFEDRKDVELVRRENGKSVRIIRIPAGDTNFLPKEQFFPIIDELMANTIAWIEGQKQGYDVYHGHYWDGGIIAARIADHYGKPSFWTPHSLGAWKMARLMGSGMSKKEANQRFNLVDRVKIEEEIIARSKKVLSLSSLQTEEYKRYQKFPRGKLLTMLPGVNVRQFQPNSGFYDNLVILPENTVFSVSRIASAKRLDLLIEAFAYVAERRPGTFLLIGGGSDDPGDEEIQERRKLRKLVTKLGLRNNVLFAGYIPHENFLPAYYRACKVFVNSASYEPFGLTILEAMACGAPVVVSKYAGASDIATRDKEFLIVDPEDAREFGRAIIHLLDDEELRQEQRQKGLKLIADKYTWERVAAEHIELYKKY